MYPMFSRTSTSSLSRVACALASALLLTSVAASAWAEGGSVIYSYESVEVGDTVDWVLVPRSATKALGGTVSKSKVIRGFDELKRLKRSTYGNSSIQVSGRMPNPKVTINVDPKYAAYALIIMAESVYTLSELGVPGVSFPGYAEGLMKREDIPFSVYTLTVPLWKALPVRDLGPMQVALPSGRTMDGEEFKKKWKAKDKALMQGLYSYLDAKQPYTINSVLALLPKLNVSYTSRVTPLLTHKNLGVRQTALKTLEAKAKDDSVLKAVAKMVEVEKDPALARAAAQWLGKSRNKRYSVSEQFYLLSKGSESEAAKAAGALVSYRKDERVVPVLNAQLVNPKASVALAAASSMTKMGADKQLIAALKNDKVAAPVRSEIARGLSKDKAASTKRAGLLYLATNAPERESVRSILQLTTIKDATARKDVEALLVSPVAYRRVAAAQALRDLRDPASLPGIAKAIKSLKGDDVTRLDDIGSTITASQPLKVVLEQTKSKSKTLQRMAYRAVGEQAAKERNNKSVFEVLKTGVKNRDPLIRGAAARAMGAFATKDAAQALAPLQKDKSADVRRDVAVALGSFKNGEMVNVLVSYLDDPSDEVKAAAIDALGARSEALAWDKIKGMIESKNARVRAAAIRGLSALVSRSDQTGVNEVISKLSGSVADSDVMVRKEALRQLGSFKSETAVASIAAQLNATEEDVRIIAFRALGRTGHFSAGELAGTGVDDASLKVRREALISVGKLKASSAKGALQERLKVEKDAEIKALIEQTLKKI